MSEEAIKKAFRKRLRTSKFPPFFPFDEPGATLIGQVTGQHKGGAYSSDEIINHVTDLNGEEFSIPGNVVIKRLWNSLNVQKGDYVMIVYEGLTTSKGGRRVKTYSMAKMTAEEFEALQKGKELPAETPAPAEKAAAPKTIEEMFDLTPEFNELIQNGSSPVDAARTLAKKYNMTVADVKARITLAKPTTKPAEISPKKMQEISQLISDILDFYDEATKQQLQELLQNSGYNYPVDEVLNKLDFVSVAGDVVRKK